MQVGLIQNYNNSYPYKNNVYGLQSKQPANKVPFRGNLHALEIANTGIKKILSEAEYDKVLAELKNSGIWSGYWTRLNGNKFDEGLMPYAGKEDISNTINTFLRNGEIYIPRYTPEIIKNFVKVLDFALGKLDETYGTYKGFVFRNGPVDKVGKNYISTARNAYGAVNNSSARRAYEDQYYIIKTENGHKIEEIQKKLNYNQVYIDESEILLEPGSYYEEIITDTPEIKAAKEQLLTALNKQCHYVPESLMNVKVLKEYY